MSLIDILDVVVSVAFAGMWIVAGVIFWLEQKGYLR